MQNVLMRFHPTRLAFIRSYLGSALLALLWYGVSYNPLNLDLSFLDQYRAYTLGLLAVSGVLVLAAELRVHLDTYTITESRITERRGILSVHESSVTWDRIADVRLDQSILERIFGIGNIRIESTGGDEAPEVNMRDVARARAIKETIDQKILEAKSGAPQPVYGEEPEPDGKRKDEGYRPPRFEHEVEAPSVERETPEKRSLLKRLLKRR